MWSPGFYPQCLKHTLTHTHPNKMKPFHPWLGKSKLHFPRKQLFKRPRCVCMGVKQLFRCMLLRQGLVPGVTVTWKRCPNAVIRFLLLLLSLWSLPLRWHLMPFIEEALVNLLFEPMSYLSSGSPSTVPVFPGVPFIRSCIQGSRSRGAASF